MDAVSYETAKPAEMSGVVITVGNDIITCKSSAPIKHVSMNKRAIHDETELHDLWDWAIKEFPHATIQPPKEFPALFVWSADYGSVSGSILIWSWIYKEDF